MKKLFRSFSLGLAAVAACAAIGFASTAKTVVSLSYLNGTYTGQLTTQLSGLTSGLQTAYDAALAKLSEKTGGQAGAGWTSSSGFSSLYPLSGETVTLAAGSGLVWHSGSASASAVLLDVTAGTELAAGALLEAGHRYLAEGETLVQSASSSACSAEGLWRTTATGTAPKPSPFKDVKAGDWYHDAVMYVVDKGLFNGTGATTFEPNSTMNRAMLVTVLHRLAGQPAVTGSNPFKDVKSSDWYAAAVLWAAQTGIVTGSTTTTFDPNGSVTREQIAVMLYRYAGAVGGDVSARASLSGFSDQGRVSGYAQDAISWAVAIGLLKGDGGRLNPQTGATRAEVATLLQRYTQA